MNHSQNERARLSAAELVLEYGWGKPQPEGQLSAELKRQLEAAIERVTVTFEHEPAVLRRVLTALGDDGAPTPIDLTRLTDEELEQLHRLVAGASGVAPAE